MEGQSNDPLSTGAGLSYQPILSQQRRFPGSKVRRASHISTSGMGLDSDWESGVRLDADWKPSSSDWSKHGGTYGREEINCRIHLFLSKNQ